jgi:hypothetical protein
MAAKTVSKPKATKWATLKKQAAERAGAGRPRVKLEPYIIDDVQPPIVIEPPDDKRLLVIAECLGPDLQFAAQRTLPLLRALCGDQFPRVWQLVPDNDPNAMAMFAVLTEELINHFIVALKDAVEAQDLPGGTGGSAS